MEVGIVAQFGLERCPVKAEVAGSSPVGPAFFLDLIFRDRIDKMVRINF